MSRDRISKTLHQMVDLHVQLTPDKLEPSLTQTKIIDFPWISVVQLLQFYSRYLKPPTNSNQFFFFITQNKSVKFRFQVNFSVCIFINCCSTP